MNALNPVMRVGDQFVDMMRAHEKISKRQALARAGELLELVGIDRQRLRSYPHQLSGGMRQRVIIAMALSLKPELIIMDEPTTALDVVVQREILQQIEALKQRLRLRRALHHARRLAPARVRRPHRDHVRGRDRRDRAVRRAARAPTRTPVHAGPARVASRRSPARVTRLTGIPGSPPDLRDPPSGCRFHRAARTACRTTIELYRRQTTERPVLREVEPGHQVACHLVEGDAE